MSKTQFTGGPWELVEGTEHHGPYICSPYGTTLCDLYAMSNPMSASVRNGGDSEPIWFADAAANARLISAAPDLYAAIQPLAEEVLATDSIRNEHILRARAAIAKAEGRQP